MARFRVEWIASAERDPAAIWTKAIDRTEVANAADSRDEALARDPHSVGESRGGTERIVFAGPLVVLFDVAEARRLVHVRVVRRIRHQ
jgi:hypothetical protein